MDIKLLKTDVAKWNIERPDGYINLRDANLCDADLRYADLRNANLRNADLRDANLRYANLRDADLRNADLRYANLCYADLRDANLCDADLRDADLCYANLRYANLRNADLCYADIKKIKFPSPTMVLTAHWGEVSDDLCVDLMRYDAACSPDAKAFTKWAEGGNCPYTRANVQRAALFVEKKHLWKPGRTKRPYDLMVRCIREKCKGSDFHGK
jgi:uncharacterized protein YjbI with pentapeptide repeats